MSRRDQAFLLLTHRISTDIIGEFAKLVRESERFGEAWLLFQRGGSGDPSSVGSSKVFTFAFEEIVASGCAAIGPTMSPGNTHFPLLRFFQDHPGYSAYWVIEYDVRFTGDWGTLFERFTAIKGDFITSHIRTPAQEPDWPFWRIAHPSESIPLRQCLRCFHPIYCISNPALALIRGAHLNNWRGHSEVLLPTLLHRNGLELVDFGGTGQFVPAGLENEFYIDSQPNRTGLLEQGTMRFRPIFASAGHLRNKLYHPVKPIVVAP